MMVFGLGGDAVRSLFPFWGLALTLITVLSFNLGATPRQEKPPQPFGPDAFAGRVLVQGNAPPIGTLLFACIDTCLIYKSTAVEIKSGGEYSDLVVSPTDRSLVGHSVRFYLANDVGRIQAAETVDFAAATDNFTLDLDFTDAIPVPTPAPTKTPRPTITPTASLPMPGDPVVTAIPRVALIVGAITLIVGTAVLIQARSRLAQGRD